MEPINTDKLLEQIKDDPRVYRTKVESKPKPVPEEHWKTLAYHIVHKMTGEMTSNHTLTHRVGFDHIVISFEYTLILEQNQNALLKAIKQLFIGETKVDVTFLYEKLGCTANYDIYDRFDIILTIIT